MERTLYERMCVELRGLLSDERLRISLMQVNASERLGELQDVLRGGIVRGTWSMYNGVMYWYNGRCYIQISYDDFTNMVYDVMRGVGCASRDMLKLESVVRVLRKAVAGKELVVDNSVMVFKNCVYDIDKDEVCDFSSKYVSFSAVDYDYAWRAPCLRWQSFLDEVLPHKEYQSILQEFIGALFVDRKKAKIERMIILKGSGSNGKSVVFETIMGLIGRDNVSNFGIDEIIGMGSERKRNIATMNGKRLNYASETQRFVIDSNSGALKALISGEPMEARAMYGDNYTARDIPLIMINANQMPEIKDYSYGMRRRIMVLPFDVEIPKWKQDTTLSVALASEYSGIFNWAMEGRKRFVRNNYKFTENTVLNRLMDEYQAERTSVLRFMLQAGYERGSGVLKDAVPIWVTSKNMYQEYRQWCAVNSEFAETQTTFGRVLTEAGYRRRRGHGGIVYAVYGEKAIKRQTEQILYRRAVEEVRDDKTGLMRIDAERIRNTAMMLMKKNGWTRCAVGFSELEDYLGYKVNFKSHLNRGTLSGMFEVREGLFFFDLNKIDLEWRPRYERKLQEQELRKKQHERLKKMLEEG